MYKCETEDSELTPLNKTLECSNPTIDKLNQWLYADFDELIDMAY